MKTKSESVNVSNRLRSTIPELRALHELLLAGDVDPRVLSDFRDALNRIRNTAWAAQQFVASKLSERQAGGVVSLLASERVRAAYQLCRSIQEDLQSPEIQFKKGQLAELHAVARELVEKLKERL